MTPSSNRDQLPEAFAIYTSPVAIMLVPKRAFALAEQARLEQTLLVLVPERRLRGVRVNVMRTPLTWLGLVVFFLVVWRLLEP